MKPKMLALLTALVAVLATLAAPTAPASAVSTDPYFAEVSYTYTCGEASNFATVRIKNTSTIARDFTWRTSNHDEIVVVTESLAAGASRYLNVDWYVSGYARISAWRGSRTFVDANQITDRYYGPCDEPCPTYPTPCTPARASRSWSSTTPRATR